MRSVETGFAKFSPENGVVLRMKVSRLQEERNTGSFVIAKKQSFFFNLRKPKAIDLCVS